MTKTALLAALVLLTGCGGSTEAHSTPIPMAPGPLSDTWVGDGTTWHQVTGAGPAARYLASLAYDAPRKDYVLFGGQTARGTSDETWTFDGTKWTAMNPAHKPPPRRNAAMAYDSRSQLVILYGGLIPDRAEGFESSDTWTWNGSDWTDALASNKASGAREGASMVVTEDGVLLFGGRVANARYFGDAWTWEGKAWRRADRDPAPPGRADAALAWDPDHSSLFVFGGVGLNATGGPGAQGTPLGDTWLFTGGRWVPAVPAGPGKVAFANAIWDTSSKRVLVLFGIDCPNPTSDAWAWDGVAWSHLGRAAVPVRWGAAEAQDTNGKVLVFGGSNEAGC